ncbi:MAG: helix-turn-helix domain-containing protein [Pseudomonadota bacterium]
MSTKNDMAKRSKKTMRTLEKITRGKLTMGKMLLAIRQCEEASQAEFADKLGISRQRLCDIEHQRRFISPKMAAHYAQILGYSAEQFIRVSLQDMLKNDGLNATVDIKLNKSKRLASLKSSFAL